MRLTPHIGDVSVLLRKLFIYYILVGALYGMSHRHAQLLLHTYSYTVSCDYTCQSVYSYMEYGWNTDILSLELGDIWWNS